MTLFRWILRRREGEAGFAWEEWLALRDTWRVLLHHTHQLSKDASNSPHIDSWAVIFLKEDDLRGTIPPGLHMSCQLSLHISPCILSLDQFRSHLLLLFHIDSRLQLLILLYSLTIDRHSRTTSQSMPCQLIILLLINSGQDHSSTRNTRNTSCQAVVAQLNGAIFID